EGHEPAWREMLAPILAPDYLAAARDLLVPGREESTDRVAEEVLLTPGLEPALGKVAQRLRAALAEQERRRAAALAALPPEAAPAAGPGADAGSGDVVSRALAAQPTWLFREHKLADLKLAPGAKAEATAAEAVRAPPGFEVVRAERHGKRVLALALSQR